MKVLTINGSPRPKGNTALLLTTLTDELNAAGIETENINLGGNSVRGCIACRMCFENKDQKCSIETDMINKVIAKMISADGIVIGSPTYFANVTAEVKALIDRAGYVGIANDHVFKRKVGVAVAAVRRAGPAVEPFARTAADAKRLGDFGVDLGGDGGWCGVHALSPG